MTFRGDRAKGIREVKRLSLTQLSKICGIGAPTLSRYEKGKSEPSINRVVQIMEALEVSVDYLLGVPEDDTESFRVTASRQALQQLKWKEPAAYFEGLEEIITSSAAPITVDGWLQLSSLLRQVLFAERARILSFTRREKHD